VPEPAAIAAALAAAHRGPVDDLPDGPRLVDYAESSREGDWSLRSALVRVAQPEPERAGAVLALIRRTDGALKPHRRRLERAAVPSHPAIGLAADLPGDDLPATVADARSADLARALVRLPDGERVVDAYGSTEALDDVELEVVRLLAVAVELDALAEALVAWAITRDGPPPVDALEQHGAAAHQRLETLGVPAETEPPRRGRG
jgi:hypothetical protein